MTSMISILVQALWHIPRFPRCIRHIFEGMRCLPVRPGLHAASHLHAPYFCTQAHTTLYAA